MIVSCKVTQPSSYFKNPKKDTALAESVTSDFELKIMNGDRLSIAVSSLSTVEDALFNSAGSGGSTVQQVVPQKQGDTWCSKTEQFCYTDLEQCRQQEQPEKNFPENWKKDCWHT